MHKKLLIPGPTEVSQEILNEQTHPLIGHRDKEFSDLYAGITSKLTKYFELPEDRIGIAIGDVSGHGVGAALIMATARAYLKAVVRKATDVPIVVTELNQLLSQDMDADKFMTLLYGELDAKNMIFRYASAGHEGPILYRKKIKQFDHLKVQVFLLVLWEILFMKIKSKLRWTSAIF